MSEYRPKWSIEAPPGQVLEAARAAGLDENAVRFGVLDAVIEYPSFFCQSQHEWIKALAHLALRNAELRVYLIQEDMSEQHRELARYRLHPRMDASMIALMREIDEQETERLRGMEDRIEEVLLRLRADEDSTESL
jgi:hypothetical protein